MTADLYDVLGDLFHFCALRAFLEQSAEEQGWPDCEATKHRAYRLYEEALAERNGRRLANEKDSGGSSRGRAGAKLAALSPWESN